MKIIIIALVLALSTSASMSTEVNLNLDYNVDGKEFKMNEEYTNTKGIKYKITRFEYYMCGFKLDDLVLDNYLLANGTDEKYPLGEFKIDKVNKITMSFGVKKEDNIEKDPNRFGFSHPLAPKDPSMHWGWAAGYRFWVVEGIVDHDNDGVYDKSFQYHVLGDEAFRTLVLDVDAVSQNGIIDINVNFDIQKLLLPIDMTKFLAYHDFYNNVPEIRDFINNISASNVITSKTTTSVESDDNRIEIYPNPTTNYLNVGQQYLNSEYEIVSLEGLVTQTGTINSNQIMLEKLSTGTYIIRISDRSGNINTAKFVKN